jgi:glucose/arabinose dehydrogenase
MSASQPRAQILVFAFLAACSSLLHSADFADSGFVEEKFAGVAGAPLGFEFAPDGRIFTWHKSGVIRIVKNGVMTSTPFLDISSRVNHGVDRGLIGVALDIPAGWVYLAYAFEPSGGDTDSAGPRTQRVTRVRVDPANPDRALAGSEEVLIGNVTDPNCAPTADCIPNERGTHTLDQLTFGSDGKLYISVGDGADFGPADIDSFHAQNLDSLNGKILRVNKDGTGVPDNPFYDGNANSNRSKVWAYGLRNPFRFTFDSATGRLYAGDVGWNLWEEIDDITRGGNYGWPCFEGNERNTVWVNAFPNECTSVTTANTIAPIHVYNHDSGTPTGKSITIGPVYRATAFPEQYRGSLFYADFVTKFIRRLTLDANGNKTGDIPFLTGLGAADFDGPVYFQVGPDGHLYFMLLQSQEIRRIRFIGGGNRPPLAQASANPTNGLSPLTVAFSSAGASDPEGQPLTFTWDFGDGSTSTEANPTHTFTSSSPVNRTVTLTVKDAQNATATAQVVVTVGNRAPIPTISTPADNTSFRIGDTVNFAGSATDPDEGNLANSRLRWELTLIHTDHEHFITAFDGVASGSFVIQEHGEGVFTYRLKLIATDNAGLAAEVQHAFPVGQTSTGSFTLSATPASATVVGGQSATFQVSVAPAAGSSFSSPVTLSCSGLPAGAACNFAPTSVTPGATPATSTLTITTAAGATLIGGSGTLAFLLAGLFLAGGLAFTRAAGRHRRAGMLCCFMVAATFTMAGCGGSRDLEPVPGPGTPVTVTITGTSGATTSSTTVALTIQ